MGSICLPRSVDGVVENDEIGPNDHPLLVVRKRMAAGSTRHAVATSLSDPSTESLCHILEEAASLASLASDPCASPSSTQTIPTSLPQTPPTPGRKHSKIVWRSEPPKFLPCPQLHDVSPLASPARKGIEEIEGSLPSLSSPAPHLNLRPRFEYAHLNEKLDLQPQAKPLSEPSIPYAPFYDKPAAVAKPQASEDARRKHNKAAMAVSSAASKLSGLSLAVSTAAQKTTPKQYIRKGVNARCA